MSRILVTGAFGYLGLAVIRALAPRGVVALGHAPRNPAARAVIPQGVEVLEGDLLDVGRLLEGRTIDRVVHLAGGGGPAKIVAEPAAAIRNNVRATTELAAVAKARGVKRLLFASTIAVYGTNRDHGRPYAESDEPMPDDPYGVIKEAAEHAWVALAGGTSLRIANIYGAGAGVDLGLQGAVERFARAAATSGELSIFGTGDQRIDYVHVDDVARAFALALDVNDTLPPVINIGGGNPIRIGELAERSFAAGRNAGRSPTLVSKPPPPGKSWPDRSLDITLASHALGWAPQISYDAGIAELVRMMLQGAST